MAPVPRRPSREENHSTVIGSPLGSLASAAKAMAAPKSPVPGSKVAGWLDRSAGDVIKADGGRFPGGSLGAVVVVVVGGGGGLVVVVVALVVVVVVEVVVVGPVVVVVASVVVVTPVELEVVAALPVVVVVSLPAVAVVAEVSPAVSPEHAAKTTTATTTTEPSRTLSFMAQSPDLDHNSPLTPSGIGLPS